LSVTVEPTGRAASLRRLAALAAFACCGLAFPAGCGEPAPVEGKAMPPQEWTRKFEKDHPGLFKKKQGRGYAEVDIRARRRILREQWQKSQGQSE
jgi:hypothetical protein